MTAYDVFVVKMADGTEDSVTETLRHHGKDNDVLFVRQCVKNTKSDTFIVCINRDLANRLIEEKNDKFTVLRYSVNRETLEYGQTWGFHIRCNSQIEHEIEDTFKRFEDAGFIRKGTYQLKKPTTEDGSRKEYVIITFKKNNDRYPKQFIRKLKGLIDYKKMAGQNIKVNWIKYKSRPNNDTSTREDNNKDTTSE